MMYLANPWGLLALAALPAIVVLHLYQRRFPPLLIGGLHLWGVQTEVRQPGRRRDRLPITSSLLFELLAALFLALVLSHPRFDHARGVEHVVLVLDNSASMGAELAGGKSFRERAVEEIDHRFERMAKGSVATILVTGRRPSLLAGPAVDLKTARSALASWKPSAPAHDFQLAWDLASQLSAGRGLILFLTDHLPPKELAAPDTMEVVAVGKSLENTAITAARWTFDSKTNKGHLFLRLGNYGKQPADVKVVAAKEDRRLFERTVAIDPQADAGLEAELPGGLGEITVESSSPGDGLPLDNRVTLIEPRLRIVTLAVTLPASHAAVPPVRKALAGIKDIQNGPAAEARLVIGTAGQLPPARRDSWWLGIGPIDPSEAARKSAKDFVGPYLLEKRHPLLEGVQLGGVIFGGVQPLTVDAMPLVSTGKQILVCRLNGTPTSAYLLNLDFARTNLAESPDWPILIENLVELCRDSMPGLKRWNYRLNENITFPLDPTAGGKSADQPLTLVFGGKSRPVARTSTVEIPPLGETGVYEIRDGEQQVGRFAVNFFDPEESNLAGLGPGVRDPVTAASSFGFQPDDPFSWLLACGIAFVVLTVIADWFVLKPVRRT